MPVASTRTNPRDDVEKARAALAGRFAFLSPGVVATPDTMLGFSQALTGRDPDGHALVIGVR